MQSRVNVQAEGKSKHTATYCCEKKKPTCSSDLKGVSAVPRAKEFLGEMTTVSAEKLFHCTCCEVAVLEAHYFLRVMFNQKNMQEAASRKPKQGV